jgi:ABC-type transport system involved in cytochrome bd biosynthesis fused ATPase/permease subunit
MPATECPQCHQPTANAMGKPFCPQCGWNRAEVDKQTRYFLRLLPVLVVVCDAPLIVWILIGHAEIPILALLGVLAIVPAILVVLVVKGKLRIGASERNP